MANTKISALTSAITPVAGTETLPIVQGGVTKQVSIANLTAGRAVSAASLTLTTTPLGTSSGGTGLSSFTQYGIVYASSTSVLATGSALTFSSPQVKLAATSANFYAEVPDGSGGGQALMKAGDAAGRYFAMRGTSYDYDPAFLSSGATNVTMKNLASQATSMTWGSTGDITINAGNLIFSTAAKGITGSSSFSVTIANGAAGNLVDLSTALPVGGSGLVIVNGASAGKTTILAQRDSGGYYSVAELGTQPRGTYITSITLSGTNLRITNSTGASETFSGKVVVLTS
jgi:hypothetical protein